MESSVVVKVKYGNSVRRFTIVPNNGITNLRGLKDKILHLFNLFSWEEQDFSLKYIDEDYDEISLIEDEDLYEAFRLNLKPLRIFVTAIKPNNREIITKDNLCPTTNNKSVIIDNNNNNHDDEEVLPPLQIHDRDQILHFMNNVSSCDKIDEDVDQCVESCHKVFSSEENPSSSMTSEEMDKILREKAKDLIVEEKVDSVSYNQQSDWTGFVDNATQWQNKNLNSIWMEIENGHHSCEEEENSLVHQLMGKLLYHEVMAKKIDGGDTANYYHYHHVEDDEPDTGNSVEIDDGKFLISDDNIKKDEEAILNKVVEMGFSLNNLTEEILKVNDYNLEHSMEYLCDDFEWDLMLEDLFEIRAERNM
ncbi:uncharacterized protein LOC115714074 isoform X1 [Cannabis sativa]|uniref:uncharacterized protein LOC115714074 isoform X1 n=1 Tax=Cannabis sativa TaxID=3483 RepID=UPI0029CA919D|nr:uncharacterized protein LOC115714074 isoform X1 [Cannabis sativa]